MSTFYILRTPGYDHVVEPDVRAFARYGKVYLVVLGSDEMCIRDSYIAILFTTFLTKTYFKDPGPVDQTVLLPLGSRLPELISGTRVSLGVILGIVIVAFLNHVMRRTCLLYTSLALT